MKKAMDTVRGATAADKNGKSHSSTVTGAKKRAKRPDPFADLERLDYPQSVGARMLKKFHESLS